MVSPNSRRSGPQLLITAFEGQGRQCFSGRFAERAAKSQLLFEFTAVDEADPSAVKQYVESQREDGMRFLDAENIAYEDSGRMVQVTYDIPHKDLKPPVFRVQAVDDGDV